MAQTVKASDFASTSSGGSSSSSSQSSSSQQTSSSGLPAWALGLIERMTGGTQNALAGMRGAVDNLNNSDALINQQMQYGMRDLAGGLRRNVGSAIGTAFGRGVNSSSMMGNMMGRIAGEAARGQNEIFKWGANQKLDQLTKRLGAEKDYTAMVGDLLGLANTSQSQGTSESSGANSSRSSQKSYSPGLQNAIIT